MKNKLIALLVLAIAAVAGYYFLFTKKGSGDVSKVTDKALSVLTSSSVATLTDTEIGAITPDQKTKLSADVLAAISRREDDINRAATQANETKIALGYTSVVDIETALMAARTAGNAPLIAALTYKLSAAQAALATAQAVAKELTDRKIKMSNVPLTQIKAYSRYELDNNFTPEELSYFTVQQNSAMIERRKVLDKQDADAILQGKADAISIISIAAYTQAQITEAATVPYVEFYSAAQNSAFRTRQEALNKIADAKALDARMMAYTPEMIDKLTYNQLKAFTDEELKALEAVSGLAYQRYRADRDKFMQTEITSKAEADFKIGVTKITQAEKDYLHGIAVDINADCQGWGGHTWAYYDQLFKLSDILFYYFIHCTWNQVDGWQLITRMKKQSYDVISKWNKANGKTAAENMAVTAAIILKIETFPYQP